MPSSCRGTSRPGGFLSTSPSRAAQALTPSEHFSRSLQGAVFTDHTTHPQPHPHPHPQDASLGNHCQVTPALLPPGQQLAYLGSSSPAPSTQSPLVSVLLFKHFC